MVKDTLSQAGAESLARAIRRYWADRGLKVEVWAEADPRTQLGYWVVRSNIVVSGPLRLPQKGVS